MAATTLTLDGDVTIQWDTTTGANHFGEIDEDPATPTDADYIETVTVADIDEWSLSATPANTNIVTDVVVNIRGAITDAGAGTAVIELSIWHSGSTQIGATQDCTITDFGGVSGTLGTTSKTWNSLSLTKAQADSMTVRAVFNSA